MLCEKKILHAFVLRLVGVKLSDAVFWVFLHTKKICLLLFYCILQFKKTSISMRLPVIAIHVGYHVLAQGWHNNELRITEQGNGLQRGNAPHGY